jgi:outer membrane protein assembly factor BamD
MRLKKIQLLLPILVLLAGACASGPQLAGMEADELFLHGMEELRERDWSKAITAFERFVQLHPTHPRAAEARYRMGEAYMGRREYVTAALEFNRLAADFPAGAWADDARFQVCVAYTELSPRPPLDQEYTRTAIDHCESLIAYYPESDYVPRAQELAARMMSRLAEKEFGTAEHYFKRRAYDSANIYYHQIVDSFAATEWAPRALLRLVESYTLLRYEQEAQAARERLLREFPNSPEARQINGVALDAGS